MSSESRKRRKLERKRTMRRPCQACEISAMCLPLDRLYAIKCQFCGKAWVGVPGMNQGPHLELNDGREESCRHVRQYLQGLEEQLKKPQEWDRTTAYTCSDHACQNKLRRQKELEKAREKAPEPLFDIAPVAEGPRLALNKGKRKHGTMCVKKKLWGGKKGVSR
jgi:hypothetical protein